MGFNTKPTLGRYVNYGPNGPRLFSFGPMLWVRAIFIWAVPSQRWARYVMGQMGLVYALFGLYFG